MREKNSKKAKETDKLIAEYKKYIKNHPKDPILYYGLGIHYYEKGTYNKAIRNIKKAISLGFQLEVGYVELAHIYLKEEKLLKSIKMLNKAITFSRNKKSKAYYYHIIGLCYGSIGRVNKALESFEKVVKYGYNIPDEYFILCHYLDEDEAISNFNKCLSLDPKSLNAYLSLALIYQKRGEVNKALENMEKADQLLWTITDLDSLYRDVVNIGWLYICIGKYSKAKNCFQKALSVKTKAKKQREKIVDYNLALASYYLLNGIFHSEKTDFREAEKDSSLAIDAFKKCGKFYGDFIKITETYREFLPIDKSLQTLSKCEDIPELYSILSSLWSSISKVINKYPKGILTKILYVKSSYVRILLNLLENKEIEQKLLHEIVDTMAEMQFFHTEEIGNAVEGFIRWWRSLPLEQRKAFRKIAPEEAQRGISRLTPISELVDGKLTTHTIEKELKRLGEAQRAVPKETAKEILKTLEPKFEELKPTVEVAKKQKLEPQPPITQVSKSETKQYKVIIGKKSKNKKSEKDTKSYDSRGLKKFEEEEDKSKYFIWIDKRRNEVFVDGIKKENIKGIQKGVLTLLLERCGELILYKELYEKFSKEPKKNPWSYYVKSKGEIVEDRRDVVQNWMRNLYHLIGDKLKNLIDKEEGREGGYKLKEEIIYCIIYRTE